MTRANRLFAQAKSLFSGDNNNKITKFGTFAGVFTPDTLTILGVIMYLRLGWVVGNAGFWGTLLIIVLAKTVTVCTGLSMSSITTNIKIGSGGAYSIISKSLGLEAGGSIGIPLYIAQTLSAALYIFGFTEAWLRVFPTHSALAVSVTAWLILLILSYTSAHLAIRVQYIIMAIIGFSLLSFYLTPSQPSTDMSLLGNFSKAGFWQVFAIFFPAVTGIMAGANMSGDLENPRRSIPLGTISSIGITMIIYISLAYILSRIATEDELLTNQMVMVDKALWGPLVIAGIMGATLSSALGSMLGAPRVLQALAEQKTVPFYRFFSVKSKNNEPRNAVIFTGAVIVVALLTGSLDYLAALITMFFLITYGTLNLVVFLEQSMKIISFRPSFKVPRFVSFFGALSCLFIMFLINPFFSIVALVIIVLIYIWLTKKGLDAEWGDIRGGLFLVLAEKMSRLAAKFPRHQISWKPDLLLPIEDPTIGAGPLWLIRNITYPSGSIFAFTIQEKSSKKTLNELEELMAPLKNQGILVNSSLIEDVTFLHGTKLVIQILKGGTFRPNILFMTLGDNMDKDKTIIELVSHAGAHEMGVVILRQHPRMAFGMQKDVNLWLRDKSPNWHLALLVTLQLQLNWGGRINLVTATNDATEQKRLENFLQILGDQARLPFLAEYHVLFGSFEKAMEKAPRADLNIFGLAGSNIPIKSLRTIPENIKSSCLYIKDSGKENALV
ncbi:Na-K-Cl cotransporter [candidate division KSB1 bacterium]|nr:Na-K-Cl cotransporter [candidate division KSB1 bacterium]